ncbi:low molecular weight protein-tyrosine-phosphatase [Candidatus Sororendozoicomonas aggregata]|uniref:low molecular weight protein-tyrosine-phosphatase n=1 Tax=Candidatus Sororendozoicomonas aggregata TaxID=3073239 RepID=UPI002ED075C8
MTTRVLFVCLGNICRSPTAHGVFSQLISNAGLADRILVDSAGTSSWHEGTVPDSRAVQVARAQGYDLSFIRSRQVTSTDFVEQDLILAMDNDNLANLQARCPVEYQQKIYRFLDFAEDLNTREVPDPYYGGNEGFIRVLSLVEHGGRALLAHLQQGY